MFSNSRPLDQKPVDDQQIQALMIIIEQKDSEIDKLNSDLAKSRQQQQSIKESWQLRLETSQDKYKSLEKELHAWLEN